MDNNILPLDADVGHWQDHEIIELLELVLSASTKSVLYGRCDQFGVSGHKRGAYAMAQGQTSGRPILRFLWGLAVRYHDYHCLHQSDLHQRTSRKGQPVSYTEIYMMQLLHNVDKGTMRRHWAKNAIQEPGPAYIAVLFNRPLEEAEALWFQYGPNKGRRGFGLL